LKKGIPRANPYILKGKLNRIFGFIATRHKERILYVNPFLNQLILMDKNDKIE
jgi:hypothetical protein